MATKLRNKGPNTISLPYPFRGLLGPGQATVIDATPDVVLAALGGDAGGKGSTLEVSEITSSDVDTFRENVLDDGFETIANVAAGAKVQTADVTLIAGAATESTLDYTATSVVVPIRNTEAGTAGDLSVGTVTPGAPGTADIASASGTDTSTVTVLVLG